jgi:hypothetical protein
MLPTQDQTCLVKNAHSQPVAEACVGVVTDQVLRGRRENCSNVDKASLTSWGVAFLAQTETESPLRSGTAMILFPCRVSFFRPCAPFFSGRETRVVLMPLLAVRRSTRSATVDGITSGLPTTRPQRNLTHKDARIVPLESLAAN